MLFVDTHVLFKPSEKKTDFMTTFMHKNKFFILFLSIIGFTNSCAQADYNPMDSSTPLGGLLSVGVNAIANTHLSKLDFSSGTLVPSFDPEHTEYSLYLQLQNSAIQVTPATENATAEILVNGGSAASGLPVDLSLSYGSNTISIHVKSPTSSNRTYKITAKRAVHSQEAYAKASTTDATTTNSACTDSAGGDHFGHSIAISGDTMVVGAPCEDSSSQDNQADNSATDSGAVYVFVRTNTDWTQKAYLKAPGAPTGSLFGQSVAIAGDTMVVGAPGQGAAGMAYLFTRTDGAWGQAFELTSLSSGSGDQFGRDVDISSAGDRIIVGAPFEDKAGADSGAAHTFLYSNSTWAKEAQLQASNGEANDWFGRSVSLDGTIAVVGAPGEDSSTRDDEASNATTESGAAYVFSRGDTAWTRISYLKAQEPVANARFGESVAISGTTTIVGSPDESSGAAYVFVTEAGASATELQKRLTPYSTTGDSRFGHDVAIFGELAAIGAPREDSYGEQADNGSTYVLARSGTSWSVINRHRAHKPDASDWFGFSVDMTDTTVVAGGVLEDSNATGVGGDAADNSATNSGAAYVFR